jgi:methionyl-tRNA formyltransferase
VRIVFFGTPVFAVPTLSALLESSHSIVAVVTQPDRPRDRGQKVRPGAIKSLAEERGLQILQPARLRDDAFLSSFRSLDPDLAIVVAYGRILPRELLDLPKLGFVNVHGSLSPRWRGAAPVHRAILAGDAITGVTIMRVVAALDAGPMLATAQTEIGKDETSAELETRLASMGAELLGTTVDRLAAGPVAATPQDETLVTYAPRLERRESRIDWARPAADVHNQIRGLQPWPLAAALLRGRRVSLHRSQIASHEPPGADAGTIVDLESGGIVVATAPGAVRITRLQAEGRQMLPASEFVSGSRLTTGDRFDPLPVT